MRTHLDADLASEGKLARGRSNADGEVTLGDCPAAKDDVVVGQVLVPQSEGNGLARSRLEGLLLEPPRLANGHLARSGKGL
jgi:hypothetical protein